MFKGSNLRIWLWLFILTLGLFAPRQLLYAQAFAEEGSSVRKSSHQGRSVHKEKTKVRIGLLLSTSPEQDVLSRSAWQGASLAVEQANKEGGYQGKDFELVVRTSDGLWGAGSKEAVKFVYEDEVVAIVTAVDGRNAHLAEQVATKSHVVHVATRASDETLSQAFVPWFFRVVPDDRQQADRLLREMEYQAHDKVVVIHADTYDQQMAAETFSKKARADGVELLGFHSYGISSGQNPEVPDLPAGTDAVVIFDDFQSGRRILEGIVQSRPGVQIYGSMSMTMDGRIGKEVSDGCEGGIFVSSRFCFTTPGQTFKSAFKLKYHNMPNPVASYAFDGLNLIIHAVREGGMDREKIRDVLKEMKYAEGTTGPIQFDDYGNRIPSVFLVRIIKGHPVILNR